MRLTFDHEITDPQFSEIGRPYRQFRDNTRQLIAICSKFDPIGWSGRMAREGQTLHHRVSIYTAGSYQRLAVMDFRFPINDLAFHPTEPKIAVASGCYDGGFCFEGELLLWDWTTGICNSLLGEWREAVRCRFNEINQIVVLLRPRHEEEFENLDAWETYLGLVLHDFRPAQAIFPQYQGNDPRLADLEPSNPSLWGFEAPLNPDIPVLTQENFEELRANGFEERHLIYDILWLNEDMFATTHQLCHVEIWNLKTGRQAAHTGEGHGVELLPHDEGLLVHVFRKDDWKTSKPECSTLFLLRGNKLAVFREFDHGCSFSTDATGNILARATADHIRHERIRTDRVLDPHGLTITERNLGDYDCFNHCLRLNSGRALYFLQGTPPTSHQNKKLCSIDENGSIQEILTWDEGESHMMSCVADFISNHELIRACEIYHSKSPGRTALIECLSITNGKSLWRTPMEGCFTAISTDHGEEIIAFSKTNGILGIISSKTGEVLLEFQLSIAGVPTIATALSMRKNMLLVGTIDGRLLLYRIAR